MQLQITLRTDMANTQTFFVSARGDAHESDAVMVRRIHVCLNLEHKSCKTRLGTFYYTRLRNARQWRRGMINKGINKFVGTLVVQCRTEKHRR